MISQDFDRTCKTELNFSLKHKKSGEGDILDTADETFSLLFCEMAKKRLRTASLLS